MDESNKARIADIPEVVVFGEKRFREENNIALCIVCQQERSNEKVVEKPQGADKLLNRIAERARYSVSDYVLTQRRIETLSDTEKHKITYHRSCYSKATNSDHNLLSERRTNI